MKRRTGDMLYQVVITMSQATVQALITNGFSLYGFKAVQGQGGGAAPLVWMQTQNYSPNTIVSWADEYLAYVSTSQIIPNAIVVPSFSQPISPGQTLQVQQGGFGRVVPGGPSSAISILNQSQTPYTCGISQLVGNSLATCCAFPLFGNMMDVIAPVNKVMLMFSTLPVNVGTVVFQAFSSAIFIDLTGSNERNVSFDINTGWSWGGSSWAQSVPPNSNLVPYLIQG
jgi:hypothetical protein